MKGRTPLYEAQNAERYARQALISQYQEQFTCRLVVFIGAIFPDSVVYFEELLSDASDEFDLHVLLYSPGGDGETAIRLIRSAHARCQDLVMLIPDRAKSAATLFAMGANRIVMGPASDLGPVDSQIFIPGKGWTSAKYLMGSLEDAKNAIATNHSVYPLYANLFADVTAVMVEEARSSFARSLDLVGEALSSNPLNANPEAIAPNIHEELVVKPRSHTQVFGPTEAQEVGLPVEELEPTSDHWQAIWRLWASYWDLAREGHGVYEGVRVSQIIERP